MRSIVIAFVVAGSGLFAANRPRPATSPLHSVRGSALNRVSEGFAFRTTVDAEQDGRGKASGKIVWTILDLSAHGVKKSGDLVGEVECMRVVGNTAYISAVVTKTFDDAAGKVGEHGVFAVQDNGKTGADLAYGGPGRIWDPNRAMCSTTPPKLPLVAVTEGHISVR